MTVAAYYALFFYTIFVGVLLPVPKQDRADDFVLGLIGRSLFVGWLIVCTSYFLKLTNQIAFLTVLVAAVLIYFASKKTSIVGTVRDNHSILFAVLLSATAAVALAMGGFHNANTQTFLEWDSLASWNAWAAQLSDNRYAPYNAAYPVLFPGLWSLIYKAQGNSQVWIVAKYSLLVLPCLLLFPLIRLLSWRLYLSAIVYAAFCYLLIFKGNFAQIFTGYMDMPVAIMMLVSSLWLYFSIGQDDFNVGTLAVAATLVGLAAITKQAGALMLVPAAYVVLAGVFTRRLSLGHAAWIVLLAATPLVTFTLMLFNAHGELIGNLEDLSQHAAASTLTRGTHSSVQASALLMWEAISEEAIVVLCASALLNVFGIKRLPGQLGVLLLVLAGIGFTIFANCCSYHIRNGWWIFSLLGASAIIGLRGLEPSFLMDEARKPVRLYAVLLACFISAGAIAVAIGLHFDTPEQIRERQYEAQSAVVPHDLKRGIEIATLRLGEQGKFITTMQMVRFFPGMEARYLYCPIDQEKCVDEMIRKHPGSIVMTSPHDLAHWYGDFASRLTPDKFIGSFDKFQLYGSYP